MSESIYTWIKPDPVVPEKPPMHVSQAWRNPLPPTTLNIAAKKPHGTFGVELKGTVRPDQFVKAHEKSGFTNSSSIPPPFTRTREPLGSSVPPQRPRAVETRPPKDFVTENAIAAILASPRTKAPAKPKDWINHDRFGKVPQYLERIRSQLGKEREYVLNLLSQAQETAASSSSERRVRELGDDERAQLINALKAKYTEVSQRYGVSAHRKISTATASVGEIRTKENCEKLMDKLDADIRKLSVPEPIYIEE